jgi:hypothetical protein
MADGNIGRNPNEAQVFLLFQIFSIPLQKIV